MSQAKRGGAKAITALNDVRVERGDSAPNAVPGANPPLSRAPLHEATVRRLAVAPPALAAVRIEGYDEAAGVVTIRVGADAVTAVLDTGVDPAVIRTALIRRERVIAQPEDGGWIVLGTLRTSATPGVDEGDDFLIKARRIDIVAGHEVNIASGAVSLALRAIGHFEALAQDITARASGVHKIVGRLVRLN